MKYCLIFAAALMLSACNRQNSGREDIIHNVYVVEPSGTEDSRARVFSGIVEENSEVNVGFKTAGEIKRVYVKEGMHVKKGQLLAQLDDADYKLGVDALQIQYDQVHDEVERAKKLFEKKSMTAYDYEKASAGLRQLGVQLQANKNKLAYTRLYAPDAGVVESVNFSVGEMVDAGTAVFTLLDVSQKTVMVDIPIGVYVKRGDISEIICSSSHTPGKDYRMSLLSIVPKADGNQLYRMKLGFRESSEDLTPGMNVEVKIVFREAYDDLVTVPQSAVFKQGDAECVWIVKPDSTVECRKITIDAVNTGKDIKVLSGIAPGERVVRAGVRLLHEGEKVNIIKAPSATNAGGML